MSKNKKNLKGAEKLRLLRQKRRIDAVKNMVASGGKNLGKAMRDAGIPVATAKNPGKIFKSRAWNDIMEEFIPDDVLAVAHKKLLNSHRLDHMVFPLEHTEKKVVKKRPKPADEDMDDDEEMMDAPQPPPRQAVLTDNDIREMLLSVNCQVRRIVHGDMGRHVYFWSPDNRALKDALEMAYKLKSRFTEKTETKHIFTGYEELTDEQLNHELTTVSKPLQGGQNQSPIPPQGEAKA